MDNVLYTDGHGIKVTTVNFTTGKTTYRIDGILNAHMKLIKARYAPALFALLLGFAAVVAGALHLIPENGMQPASIGGVTISINTIAIIIGAVLLIGGAIVLAMQHDKYSVHIVS